MNPGERNSNFAPGEAEDNATRIRAYFREAQQARDRGDAATAQRLDAEGSRELASLLRRITGVVDRYARGWFGSDPELVQDAAQEILLDVCRKLRDISRHRSFSEIRFGTWLEKLSIDALRRISRREKPWGKVASLDKGWDKADNDEWKGLAVDTLSDPAAEAEFERRISDGRVEAVLQRLSYPKYARVVVMRVICGYKWKEIAMALNISERSARNYYAEARKELAVILSATPERSGSI